MFLNFYKDCKSMLESITIKNFGLIDSVSLEFDKSLNILTGETGAGKSIIIDALRIVLGDKITSSFIRDKQKACVIEAVFNLNGSEIRQKEDLKDFVDEDSNLIINRTYSSDGKNKIKINGLTVTNAQLKEIGNYLIDFHGPHDHQMLLCSEYHLSMLDRLIDFSDQLLKYQEKFKEFKEIKSKIKDLENMSASRERDLDLLSHQVKELEQVDLNEEVYFQLKDKKVKINNSEKINQLLVEVLNSLDSDSGGASEHLRKAFSPIRHLADIDPHLLPFESELENVQESLENIVSGLKDYGSDLMFDASEALEVNEKCDLYDDILKKYGSNFEKVKVFYQDAKAKLDTLSNLEFEDSKLRKDLEKVEKELVGSASKLTVLREKCAKGLKKTIESELKELGISNVKFDVRIEKQDFSLNGADNVSFYISPNAGEELKPLSQIVSSGEAARVMLALKKALIKVDPVDVLIFDEIDAQIGGRLGTITGSKLKEISTFRQVILITHLPQIASFADIHFKVIKEVENNRTITKLIVLGKKERVSELAQMMSGENLSEISLKHANELLLKASKVK